MSGSDRLAETIDRTIKRLMQLTAVKQVFSTMKKGALQMRAKGFDMN